MDLSDIWSAIVAAVLSLIPVSGKLEGTWIETEQIRGNPRIALHFHGRNVTFENLHEKNVSVKYKVSERNLDDFTITVEYRHPVKKLSGRIVEHEFSHEFLYHIENGLAILSEKEFEYDGRGTIITSEYLRKPDFVDDFQSELKKKYNAKK